MGIRGNLGGYLRIPGGRTRRRSAPGSGGGIVIPGTVVHGQPFTLSAADVGGAFGTHEDYGGTEPYLMRAVPSALPTGAFNGGGWYRSGNEGNLAIVTNDRFAGDAAVHKFQGTPRSLSYIQHFYDSFASNLLYTDSNGNAQVMRRCYLGMWFKYLSDPAPVNYSGSKYLRIYDGYGEDIYWSHANSTQHKVSQTFLNENGKTAARLGVGRGYLDAGRSDTGSSPVGSDYAQTYANTPQGRNEWHYFEIFLNEGTQWDAPTANDLMLTKVNNRTLLRHPKFAGDPSHNGLNTNNWQVMYQDWVNPGPTSDIRSFQLGSQLARNSADAQYHSWLFSNPVINFNWARVILGNQPTYATCTHWENQWIQAWSDTELTCQGYVGALPLGACYAYVFRADGTLVSETGRALTAAA